jgi:hypothetical protein
LLVKQLPKASRTALLAKFSLAINSRPIFCRSSSLSIKAANSGSNFDKASIFLALLEMDVVALEREEGFLPTDVRRRFFDVLICVIVKDLANASTQNGRQQQYNRNSALTTKLIVGKTILI